MKKQLPDFTVFRRPPEDALPNTAWARAGRVDGQYGICLGEGPCRVGFIPDAEVEQAIADWRAEAGADDVLVFELERAAADLPRLRSLRIDEIVARRSGARRVPSWGHPCSRRN
jgi:hypothetical protein